MAKRFLGLCTRCWERPQHEEVVYCEICFRKMMREPPPLPKEALREWCVAKPLCRFCGLSGAHTEKCQRKRPPPLPRPRREKPPALPKRVPQPPIEDAWLKKLEADAMPNRRLAKRASVFLASGFVGVAVASVLYVCVVVIPRHIPDSPRSSMNHRSVKELKLEDMNETHAVDLTQR